MPVCRKPISGRALTMVSPSSSSTTRRTPCVDGCCGPMFRVIRRVLRLSCSASATRAAGVVVSLNFSGLLIFDVVVAVAVNGVIFAQRVAFPVFRHENPLEIRMATEGDAEQIEHFAFVPVGR